MANVLIKEETMTAIGESIRAKTGKTDLILPANMPAEIEGIQSGGNDDILKGIIERNLMDITLPERLTSIGVYAFYNCTDLALTSLPEGIRYIRDYAFYNCASLDLTSLPEELRTISDYAFYNCTSLALTSLPEGLTTISNYTFSNCTRLTEITFKGTPTKINSSAFKNCTNLLTINVPWAEGAVANAPWGASKATINYNYTEG